MLFNYLNLYSVGFEESVDAFLRYLSVNWDGGLARFKKTKSNCIWLQQNFGLRKRSGPGAKEKLFEEYLEWSDQSFSDNEKVLSDADSLDILMSCKFSKRKYENLVKVLRTKGVILKSYQTLRVKLLKNIKSDLPIVAENTFAKIDPNVALKSELKKFLKINKSNYQLSEVEFVIAPEQVLAVLRQFQHPADVYSPQDASSAHRTS